MRFRSDLARRLAGCLLVLAAAAPADADAIAPPVPAPPDAAAAGAPAPSPMTTTTTAPPTRLELHPFLVMIGGLSYDHIVNRPAQAGMAADERASRGTTVALSRFGLVGEADHVQVRSEVELSAGPHGASVWEGQAALTVRDQYLGLHYGDVRVQVGRITDPASIDYYATHVANLLLTDLQLRLPFLSSGANRGNGVAVRYQLGPELAAGLVVNAGNPVSNTGTAMLGGTYPPFARFYYNIVATVRESATRFPSDLFHAVLASPSLTYDGPWFRAQLQYQYVVVDVTTADRDNPLLHGHNVRGGIQGRLQGDRLRPFVNFSYVTNEIIAAQGAVPDVSHLSEDLFQGLTTGVGADLELAPRFGVGAQHNVILEQQGGGAVFTSHFVNVGASWQFHPQVALDGRYGLYLRCKDTVTGGCADLLDHQHTAYLTLRGVFGGVPARAAGTF